MEVRRVGPGFFSKKYCKSTYFLGDISARLLTLNSEEYVRMLRFPQPVEKEWKIVVII
jgi:hypothetical protein